MLLCIFSKPVDCRKRSSCFTTLLCTANSCLMRRPLDKVAQVGAVALPGLGLVLRSDKPSPLGAHDGPPRMLVSRTRASKLCAAVSQALPAATIGMGSAGAKAMAVVLGEAEIYLHSGGQHQWDNCAPAAVALATGLHASRIDGSPLRYNEAGTVLPDLLICRRELADAVLALVADCPD